MEGVPENALQPLYFVAEMLDTETSQLACADTETHVFHVGNTARNHVLHGDNPFRACPTSATQPKQTCVSGTKPQGGPFIKLKNEVF